MSTSTITIKSRCHQARGEWVPERGSRLCAAQQSARYLKVLRAALEGIPCLDWPQHTSDDEGRAGDTYTDTREMQINVLKAAKVLAEAATDLAAAQAKARGRLIQDKVFAMMHRTITQ